MRQQLWSITTTIFAWQGTRPQVPISAIDAPVLADLPEVDLGYEIHRATENDILWEFKNIRYGKAPVEKLRFAPPVLPDPPKVGEKPPLNNGSFDPICHQYTPYWVEKALPYVQDYANPLVNLSNTEWIKPPPEHIEFPELVTPDDRENEDCLFLDVIVPKSIYDNKDGNPDNGADVMLWFFGGGYVFGYKDQGTNKPIGLIERAMNDGADNKPIIYVTFNYRVGAFGWLAGGDFTGHGGTPNVGLLDQRLVLEWVREKIVLFGGNPKKVTVFGESAGASSIMHQITAISTITGANRHVFKRAILQSPAFFPVGDNINPEKTYDNYLEAAGNAQDLEELRALPPNDARVVRANALTIQAAPYGQFVYGPVVDGYYVTSLPGRLLRDGHWDHDVEIMVGYNSNEGLLFTPPYIQSDAMFEQYIRQVFPEAKDEIISYITDTLYPSPGEGATPREKISRLNEALGAAAVACNTYYLNKAADNGTYSYMFSVYPGLHGQDIPYMHYPADPPPKTPATHPNLAKVFQQYLVNFAKRGNPNGKYPIRVPLQPGKQLQQFDKYGAAATQNNLHMDLLGNTVVVDVQTDPLSASNCEWWMQAYYY